MFSLTFDGGFDSNASIGDVPEIEFPICDLVPVIIKTDIDISVWFGNVLSNYDLFNVCVDMRLQTSS